MKDISVLADFYEMIMGNGYFKAGITGVSTCFDMFFRKVPDNGGYVIAAGLETLCEAIDSLSFSEDDIDYLREMGIDSEEYLDFLRNFRFSGDISALPEGTVAFPNEPIVSVRAPVAEAQLIETLVLCTVNHQSRIATKASRMVTAADGRPVAEIGARRAHGIDAAVNGARAAYIGGCESTSCLPAAKKFGIPVIGTMSHSWVQLFLSEYEAFRVYCEQNPERAVLLIDTYNVLHSGIENAIRAFRDVLLPRGIKNFAVRIDSGDIGFLAKTVRERLDRAGLFDCRIIVSNSLDEFKIKRLVKDSAPIDVFGVGERLITASSDPVLGGVYKLAATEENGIIMPKIKISESPGKLTVPGIKKIVRYFDRASGTALADELMLDGERLPLERHTIFHPENTWKSRTLTDFETKELMIPVYTSGKRVWYPPSLAEVRETAAESLSGMPPEVYRLDNPTEYCVDFSEKLWTMRRRLTGQRRVGMFR